MNKRVTYLRHAESVFNATGIDGVDVALSAHGVSQAKGLDFTNADYDLCIVSPLRRALQTVSFATVGDIPIIQCDHVREHRINVCDFLEGEPVILESESDLLARIYTFQLLLQDYIKTYNSILVVTHSDYVWYMLSTIDKSGERFGQWLGNCESVTVLIPSSF